MDDRLLKIESDSLNCCVATKHIVMIKSYSHKDKSGVLLFIIDITLDTPVDYTNDDNGNYVPIYTITASFKSYEKFYNYCNYFENERNGAYVIQCN